MMKQSNTAPSPTNAERMRSTRTGTCHATPAPATRELLPSSSPFSHCHSDAILHHSGHCMQSPAPNVTPARTAARARGAERRRNSIARVRIHPSAMPYDSYDRSILQSHRTPSRLHAFATSHARTSAEMLPLRALATRRRVFGLMAPAKHAKLHARTTPSRAELSRGG